MRRLAVAAIGLGVLGCDAEFQERIVEDLRVTSTFIEHSDEGVAGSRVPILDGSPNNVEWGSPDDPQRPFTFVQLRPDNGFGNPGPARFMAVKSAYTAEWDLEAEAYRVRNVYFLFQWADITESRYMDSFVYQGPNLSDEQPRILAYYTSQGMSTQKAVQATRDSVQRLFFEDGRARTAFWRQEGNDDRLLVFLGDGEATDADGRNFRTFGVQIARNGASFGPLESGFLDVWEWSASRTNPMCETTVLGDIGGDVQPDEGFSGYMDDYFVDSANPLTRDDGPRLYIDNFDRTLPRSMRVPIVDYNPGNDESNDVQPSKCQSRNFGYAFPWLHRRAVRGSRLRPDPDDDRFFNFIPFKWETKEPEVARLYEPDDFVTGYLLGHDYNDQVSYSQFAFCTPGCLRPAGPTDTPNCLGQPYGAAPHTLNTLQVRANGRYDPPSRHWIVEALRPTRTPWGNANTVGNPVQDFDFDRLLEESRDFYISLVLYDDAPEGGAYWGSPAVRLHFDPPPPREDP